MYSTDSVYLPEQVVEQVKVLGGEGDNPDDPDRKNNIVFNATSEFCRTLGDIPTYGLSGNREDQEDIMVSTPPGTLHLVI